jgi:hypothetical protein
MSHVLAKLLCVAAVTTLALPVFAQAPQAEPKSTDQTAQAAGTSTAGAPTAPTAISQEEKAARAACESKPAGDKEKCLKDLDAKYGKTGDKMSQGADKMAPSGDMATKPKEDTTKSGSYK